MAFIPDPEHSSPPEVDMQSTLLHEVQPCGEPPTVVVAPRRKESSRQYGRYDETDSLPDSARHNSDHRCSIHTAS